MTLRPYNEINEIDGQRWQAPEELSTVCTSPVSQYLQDRWYAGSLNGRWFYYAQGAADALKPCGQPQLAKFQT